MKRYLQIVIGLFFTVSLPAQNFIANPGFEDINTCGEYGALCAPEAWFRIPPTDVNVNSRKIDRVFAGENAEIVVIENIRLPISYRMFLYTMLLQPLEAGKTYDISFYINPIYLKTYSLGLLFTKKELIAGNENPLAYHPSILVTPKNEVKKSKKSAWRKIVVPYLAKGGEQFLTIGNFSQDAFEFTKKIKTNNAQGDLILLLDNFQLTPTKASLPVDTSQFALNRKRLYLTNHRHTYKKGVIQLKSSAPKALPTPKTAFLNQGKQESIAKPPVQFEIPDVAFDFDQFIIRKEYINLLDSLYSTIERLSPKQLTIIGHTDSVGDAIYNQTLSLKRAQAIETFFLEKSVNWKGKIQVEGKGDTQPKVANDSPENRALNRRVELIVLFK